MVKKNIKKANKSATYTAFMFATIHSQMFVIVFAFSYLPYLQHRLFDALCTFHKLIRFLEDFSNIFLGKHFGCFFFFPKYLNVCVACHMHACLSAVTQCADMLQLASHINMTLCV